MITAFLVPTGGPGGGVDGIPACDFPPEGPGVCLFCPCARDYYILFELGTPGCNSLRGRKDGVVDIIDLLYLLAHWGEAVQDVGGCGPDPACDHVGVMMMLWLFEEWGPCQ